MVDDERASMPEEEGKKRKGRNWMLLFLIAGIAICLKGYFDLQEAMSSYSWLSTSGQIVSSQVKKVDRFKEAPSFYADIAYEYQVAGKKYRGERIFFGEYGSGSEKEARSWVDKYRVGQTVTVYYHPRQPERAVLERGARFATFVLIFIGLIFGLVGLGGFVWWDRLHTRPKWLERAEEMRPYYRN